MIQLTIQAGNIPLCLIFLLTDQSLHIVNPLSSAARRLQKSKPKHVSGRVGLMPLRPSEATQVAIRISQSVFCTSV